MRQQFGTHAGQFIGYNGKIISFKSALLYFFVVLWLINAFPIAPPTAPVPPMAIPVCILLDVLDFWVAHVAASGPFGFDRARANDAYVPDVLPVAMSSYNPDVADSKIGCDSMPGCMSNAALRFFKSLAKLMYSAYILINSLPPGSSIFLVPYFMFLVSP